MHGESSAPRRRLGRHAIVIGGSVAGLAAARVLADHFGAVTILERDPRPQGPEPRKGAPQMRHVHALFFAASTGLEALFPGFIAELRAAGALERDFANANGMYQYGAWKPRFRAGFDVVACSRPLIEWHIRRRVEALANVTVRHEHVADDLIADDLITDAKRRRVTGVRVRGPAGEETLAADLVLDAGGRGSRAPRWLEALGHGRPEEQSVGIDLAYVSATFARADDARRDWSGLVVTPRAPGRRGGFLLAVEGDRWLASMTGMFGDHCPTDAAGFLEFARSLPVPDIHAAIEHATPLSAPVMHKIPSSRWLHFEKMATLPDGLVMLGDSVCALNPVYGQGITVAIQCVRELEAALVDLSRGTGDLRGLPPALQRRLARVIAPSWLLSTTMDLRYPEATGARAPGLSAAQWLFASFLDMTTVDERACRLLFDLMHMRRGPAALLRPGMLVPFLAYCARSPFVPLAGRIRQGPLPPAV